MMHKGYLSCGGDYMRNLSGYAIGEIFKEDKTWSVMLFASQACVRRGNCDHGPAKIEGAPRRSDVMNAALEVWDSWHPLTSNEVDEEV